MLLGRTKLTNCRNHSCTHAHSNSSVFARVVPAFRQRSRRVDVSKVYGLNEPLGRLWRTAGSFFKQQAVQTSVAGEPVVAEFTDIANLNHRQDTANGHGKNGNSSKDGNGLHHPTGVLRSESIKDISSGNNSSPSNGFHANLPTNLGSGSSKSSYDSAASQSMVDVTNLDYPTMLGILKEVDVSQLNMARARDLFQDPSMTALDLAEFKQFVLAVQKGEFTAEDLGTFVPGGNPLTESSGELTVDDRVGKAPVSSSGNMDEVRMVLEQSRSELRALLQDPAVKQDLLKGATGDPKKWEQLMAALDLPYEQFEAQLMQTGDGMVGEDDVDMDLVDEMLQEYLANQALAKGGQDPGKQD